MKFYSIELRTRKYLKVYRFFLFARNLPDKYREKIIEYYYKNRG